MLERFGCGVVCVWKMAFSEKVDALMPSLIEISGVGRFSASKKWRRDTDIGAKFELSDADRLRLADRLAARFSGRSPLVRPQTAPTSPF